MLFLANWSVTSMGQLYALVTPNEETANGLAGLSVILSVCLMGFLITSSAMPQGWLWANTANMFRYILQGLVTNELSGQNYKIDIGALIPPVENTPTADGGSGRFLAHLFDDSDGKVITFMPGTVPECDNTAAQGAALLGLALHAGEGENSAESEDDFRNLLECMVLNKCLVEPVPTNFLECNVSNDSQVAPVCFEQFKAVIANLEDSERQVGECFIDIIERNEPSSIGAPASLKLGAYTEEKHREIASCLTRKLLIKGPAIGLKSILNGFSELWDIVMFIQDIIENGLDIPGGEYIMLSTIRLD